MVENTPSRTAEIVALMRALEYVYNKEKSIIGDKYAVRFLSKRYLAVFNRLAMAPDFISFFVNASTWGLFDYVSLRHAFIDGFVRKYAEKMPVILLGAGYDSRALRFASVLKQGIWELDFPATQRRKKFILRTEPIQNENLHFCEVDFMHHSLADILDENKIPRKNALIIWEGVSMYVTEDVVRSTIHEIGNHFGSGSTLIFDYWHDASRDPFQRFVQTFLPYLMDWMYGERFIFASSSHELRDLSLNAGAKTFESNSAKQMMKKLSLTSRLPLESASVAVVGY